MAPSSAWDHNLKKKKKSAPEKAAKKPELTQNCSHIFQPTAIGGLHSKFNRYQI